MTNRPYMNRYFKTKKAAYDEIHRLYTIGEISGADAPCVKGHRTQWAIFLGDY